MLRCDKNKVQSGCLRRDGAGGFSRWVQRLVRSAQALLRASRIFSAPYLHPAIFAGSSAQFRQHILPMRVLFCAIGLFVFLMTSAAYAADESWKDHITFNKGKLSVEVSGVLLGELLKEIGSKAGIKITVDSADTQRRITVSFHGKAIEKGIEQIGNISGVSDIAMVYDPAKGGKKGAVSAIAMKSKKDNKAALPEVKDIPTLVSFIKQVGSQDDCEQTYWAMSSLGLGGKSWWQKASKIQKLLETAKNSEIGTCARMASLELYISKLSKEELQKILPDLQSYFGAASVPDKLVARLTQILAERDVAPTQLIETILESDARGQAARSHAWYAAGRTQTYTPHLVELAMQDANSAGTTQSVTGKMALEYMSKLPLSSVAAEDESKVNVSVVQAVNRAIELPNDTGLNELGRSMAAVSAIPRFLPKAEVVPFLDQVIVKAANDNVKLMALDVLLSIQTDYASEVAAQTKKITDNLETIFTDAVSRERAKARLNMLGRK